MKIRYDILLRTMLSAAVALSLASCLSNFDEYNHNPNETTDEELRRDNYLTGSYLEALMDQVIPAEEHQYQFSSSPLSASPTHATRPRRRTAGSRASRASTLRSRGSRPCSTTP